MKANNSMNYRALTVTGILAAFVWCMACSFFIAAIGLCSSVSVRWEIGGVSPSALVRQQKYAKQDGLSKQPQVTLWQVYSAQEIMDADMGSTTADVVVVFGACEDITSKTILVGSLPSQSDTAGCAISSKLAFSLWGSTNVLGMQIKIGGEVLYVRGVFDDDTSRVFRQAEEESSDTLSNMQLIFSDGGTREMAERYLTASDFTGGTIIDLPLMGWVFGMIYRLPALVLAFGIVIRLIKRGGKLRHYPMWMISYLPLALIALAGLVICIDLPHIPSSFIPSRWSDFKFWKNLFLDHWENLTVWMSAAPTFRDKELWNAAFLLLLFSLFASILMAIAARITSIRSYSGLVLSCVIYTLSLCLISVKIVSYNNISIGKVMYFMPCLWLCIDLLLHWQGGKLGFVSHERRFSVDKNSSLPKKEYTFVESGEEAQILIQEKTTK